MTDARIVTSTADLTPRGIAGYAKAVVNFCGLLGAGLAVIVPYLDPASVWARWVGGTIAVLAFIGGIAIPNAVEPVVATPVGPAGPDVITGVVAPPDAPKG